MRPRACTPWRERRLPLGRPHLEEMIDVGFALGARLESERQAGEPFAIPSGDLAPMLVPFFEARQLPGQDPRLQRVELGIESDHHVVVLSYLSELALPPERLVELCISRHDCSAVARRGEVLARVEAEASEVAERAHRLPLRMRSEEHTSE